MLEEKEPEYKINHSNSDHEGDEDIGFLRMNPKLIEVSEYYSIFAEIIKLRNLPKLFQLKLPHFGFQVLLVWYIAKCRHQ